MNYQRDEFLRLIEAVEDQDGTHLDETCAMKVYDKWTGDEKVNHFYHPGCGNSALFEVPVAGREAAVGLPMGEKGEGILPEEGLGYLGLPESGPPIKVCAVEDGMGWWPRFADQVSG